MPPSGLSNIKRPGATSRPFCLAGFRPARYSGRMTIIYKICSHSLWSKAEADGVFQGAPIDLADGYIHFSTASQVRETAIRHFAGQADLVLVAIEAEALGEGLRYEPSRGGDLFPHLYGPLSLTAVCWVKPLPLGKDGLHTFAAILP